MIKFNAQFGGLGLLAIIVVVAIAVASPANAVPLTPGQTSNTPDQFSLGYSYSPPVGSPRTVLATTSSTWGGSSGFFGEFYEQVESDPGNTYCSGCLDFRFQIQNDSSSNANALTVELAGFGSYLTDVGWEIQSVNSSYECGPDDNGFCNSGDPSEIPGSVYRSSDGNTVGFDLGGIVAGDSSVDLTVETNALSYMDQSLNVFNAAGLEENGIAIGPGGVPMPEPSSLAILFAGLAAIGGAFYLTRKKAVA